MHYDLIIVGGGLVGASLALALQDTRLSIALVDARQPNNDDPRLFALNASSCQLLKNLKLWAELEPYVSPIHQVHVSHKGYFGSVKLHCQHAHLTSLGHVIPARNIEAIFNARLQSLKNLTIYQPSTLKKLVQQNNEALLTIETSAGEKILQAPFVIGADGTESTVRMQLNIVTEINDYQQSAIVTRTVLKRSHQQIAYERFTQNGAIAMLPLLDNECATIWSANENVCHELMALDESQFLYQLQKEFGYRLGQLQKIHKRYIFPLRMLKAEKMTEGCVFLLGNAAHTLHPIAAQGFNLALYEVAVLAEKIMKQLAKDQKLTAFDLQYVSELTQQQRNSSIKLSHQLAEIFSKQSVLINFVLQLGMTGLNIATPIKLKFIRQIMGRNNKMPRLLLNASEF